RSPPRAVRARGGPRGRGESRELRPPVRRAARTRRRAASRGQRARGGGRGAPALGVPAREDAQVMDELPPVLLAQDGAPRRHRALWESDADHVMQLAVGVLRDVEHEIRGIRGEGRVARTVAALTRFTAVYAALASSGD